MVVLTESEQEQNSQGTKSQFQFEISWSFKRFMVERSFPITGGVRWAS